MVGVAVMLGEVIGFVESAFLRADDKLALVCLVANPVKAHVDGFGSFLLDSVVSNARGSSVVSGNWSWCCGWLSSSCVIRSGHASHPLWKRAATSSVWAVLARTSRIICT
jgi:hypothetical protein